VPEDLREVRREGGKVGGNDAQGRQSIDRAFNCDIILTSSIPHLPLAAPNASSNIAPIKSGSERSDGWRPR